MELPVQACVYEPQPGSVVSPDPLGCVQLKGYAWSGGGRGIERVDLSFDQGATWRQADLVEQPKELVNPVTHGQFRFAFTQNFFYRFLWLSL
jgi:hypothetical protein